MSFYEYLAAAQHFHPVTTMIIAKVVEKKKMAEEPKMDNTITNNGNRPEYNRQFESCPLDNCSMFILFIFFSMEMKTHKIIDEQNERMLVDASNFEFAGRARINNVLEQWLMCVLYVNGSEHDAICRKCSQKPQYTIAWSTQRIGALHYKLLNFNSWYAAFHSNTEAFDLAA